MPSKDQASKTLYGTGDRIEIILDIDQHEIRFAKNGRPVDGVIREVRDAAFLRSQEDARRNGAEPAEGCGEFRLLLSMSPGDHVEVEESPYGLSYPVCDAVYPWGAVIAPNEPVVLAGAWPLRFSVNRALPDGLRLDEETGAITGTPSGKTALDLPGWRKFCVQMYRGRLGEQGWSRARAAILKALGPGLGEEDLRERARELFKRFDADGSGEIEFQELQSAMESLHVQVTPEELMVGRTLPATTVCWAHNTGIY